MPCPSFASTKHRSGKTKQQIPWGNDNQKIDNQSCGYYFACRYNPPRYNRPYCQPCPSPPSVASTSAPHGSSSGSVSHFGSPASSSAIPIASAPLTTIGSSALRPAVLHALSFWAEAIAAPSTVPPALPPGFLRSIPC